jgi:1,3-beta-glucan synthase
MKQSKLRKRRVWRYAVLYFVLLVVFLALVVGPIVAGTKILSPSLTKIIPDNLFQPINQNNNDTRNYTQTGTGAKSGASGASATPGASVTARMIQLF